MNQNEFIIKWSYPDLRHWSSFVWREWGKPRTHSVSMAGAQAKNSNQPTPVSHYGLNAFSLCLRNQHLVFILTDEKDAPNVLSGGYHSCIGYAKSGFQISLRKPVILTWVLREFLQSFQSNIGLVPPNRPLSLLFQFLFNSLLTNPPVSQRYITRAIGSIIK
jgi:hypothetical protein